MQFFILFNFIYSPNLVGKQMERDPKNVEFSQESNSSENHENSPQTSRNYDENNPIAQSESNTYYKKRSYDSNQHYNNNTSNNNYYKRPQQNYYNNEGNDRGYGYNQNQQGNYYNNRRPSYNQDNRTYNQDGSNRSYNNQDGNEQNHNGGNGYYKKRSYDGGNNYNQSQNNSYEQQNSNTYYKKRSYDNNYNSTNNYNESENKEDVNKDVTASSSEETQNSNTYYKRPQQPRYNDGNNNYQQQSYYKRPEQNRYDNQGGGYQQRRPYNNDNRTGGYNNDYNQGGYKRPYNNNNQGYNNNYNQGGGYQQRRPYNNDGQGGGYQQRPQQGGGYQQRRPYNNDGQGGGYQQRNNYQQRGGYQQRPQQGGGYQQRSYQGGYQDRRGYQQNNRPYFEEPLETFTETPILPNEREEEEGMRINKYIAHAGICARRKADDFIRAGRIFINGEVMDQVGYRVKKDDVVTVDGASIKPTKKYVYILLNKPRNVITTVDDEQGRRTVMDLITPLTTERVYPVGRLDRDTTGLVLLTNDGELAQRLAQPNYEVKKIYEVTLDKPLSSEDLELIRQTVELEDGAVPVDRVEYVHDAPPNVIGIELNAGRNRVVRRLFEHLGYRVMKLDRVKYAMLTKKGLPRGKCRFLNTREITILKHLFYKPSAASAQETSEELL